VKPQDLHARERDANRLTNAPELDRLLRTMARWWDGWTYQQIADAEGISRQRVGRLLAQVGCTRALWRKANRTRRDSGFTALPMHIADARDALMHPRARRLTVRQRAALAWLAQGLRQSDIARRMVTTPQNVRNLLVAARWRLERLSRPKRRKRAGQRVQRAAPGVAPPAGDEGVAIDWDGLLDGIDAPRSPVNKRDGNGDGGAARGGLADRRHVCARRARGGGGTRSRRLAPGQRRCCPGPTRANRAPRAASD